MAKAKVAIIGLPGVGKTRWSGVFPNPLILDADNGSLVLPKVNVNTPAPGQEGYNVVLKTLQQISRNKSVQIDGVPITVGTVVLDSVDRFVEENVAAGVRASQNAAYGQYWYELSQRTRAVIREGVRIANNGIAHFVAVIHTRVVSLQSPRQSRARATQQSELNLPGQLSAQLPGYFDFVIEFVLTIDGVVVITEPTTVNGVWHPTPKSRVGVVLSFNNKLIRWSSDGFPAGDIAKAIIDVYKTDNAARWVNNPERVEKFLQWCKSQGLTESQVNEALGCDITQYEGTPQEAMSAVHSFKGQGKEFIVPHTPREEYKTAE